MQNRPIPRERFRMKLGMVLIRILRWTERYVVKCAFGISPEDLDLILKEVFSFVCTPIMFGFGFNRIAPTSYLAYSEMLICFSTIIILKVCAKEWLNKK